MRDASSPCHQKGAVAARADYIESVGGWPEPRQECRDMATLRLRNFDMVQPVGESAGGQL